MPITTKRFRLVNPGRTKKGGMSLKQLLHFGSPTQRQHAAKVLGVSVPLPFGGKAPYQHRARKVRVTSTKHRRRNVGSIVLLGANPGSAKSQFTKEGFTMPFVIKRKRRARPRARVANARPRRRTNAHRSRARIVVINGPKRRCNARRRNPVVRYPRQRNAYRRRNPSVTAIGVQVAGVLAGATATKIIVGMLPTTFQSGILKYIATAVVASGLGYGVSKFAHKPEFGANLTVGGYTLLGLEVINDLMPSLYSNSALGLQGLGNLLTPGSFYVPQVPVGASMSQFVTPLAVTSAIPAQNPAKRSMGSLAVVRRRA